jgi:hypothetical protein
MGKSKFDAEKRHAKMRALERYNLELNDHQYNNLCNIIRTGGSKIVFKQSNRVTIHELTLISGLKMTVVYDKLRNAIVSFLPDSSRFEPSEY